MKNLLGEKYEDLFEPQIIYRGKEYYRNNLVKRCLKTPEGYLAKVIGSKDYNVKIKIMDDDIEMFCDCPYGSNCKHEYATLMAIDNQKYKELNLLPKLVGSKYNFAEFVKLIPENDLKTFIIDKVENEEDFEELEEELKEKFFKYLPKETPEYFYNEIFNLCLIEDDLPTYIINEYIDNIKKQIDCKEYDYAFSIYSSLICALCDSKIEISSTKLIDLYSKIGIFARISYRKGSDELKNYINNWISQFAEKNYYDDVYLEDLLLSIR